MFIFLDKASIYTSLHQAFNLLDLALWGGVWTPSHLRPFKIWFEFEVHLDQLFARQGWGNDPNNSSYLWMRLLRRWSSFMLSSSSENSSSAWRLLFPFSCLYAA